MHYRSFRPPRRPSIGCSGSMIMLFLGTLLLTGVLSGCDSKGKAPQQPQVVTQKIVQPKAPEAAAPPKTPAPETAAAPAAKTDAPRPGAPSSETGPAPKPGDLLALFGLASKGAAGSPGAAYDPKGKIDPFEPLFQQEPAASRAQKKKVRKGPLTPLERVDLSQLKLTGVILAQSGNKALIKEASGKGYIVKVGTPIGINSGKIVAILKDRVVVEEEIEDVMGKVSVLKKEMALQKPPGE